MWMVPNQDRRLTETLVVFPFQDDVTITDIINGSAAAAAMSAGGDASSACGSTGTAASSSGGERGIDVVGRVGSWATDFEKLLRDPLGLQTFTVSLHIRMPDERGY